MLFNSNLVHLNQEGYFNFFEWFTVEVMRLKTRHGWNVPVTLELPHSSWLGVWDAVCDYSEEWLDPVSVTSPLISDYLEFSFKGVDIVSVPDSQWSDLGLQRKYRFSVDDTVDKPSYR